MIMIMMTGISHSIDDNNNTKTTQIVANDSMLTTPMRKITQSATQTVQQLVRSNKRDALLASLGKITEDKWIPLKNG